ncbi:hypothetical protein FK268_13685 [Tsukamurella sputi]|uniref:Core-binding (CB) domain-containing protein n=1 Tax=Tsukamurella sputi TaxID=2591848 RepID=A0A5C5RMU1_9ACTN|nr:hypothetical protein FK268_13685 [Tsukamurella sputi]
MIDAEYSPNTVAGYAYGLRHRLKFLAAKGLSINDFRTPTAFEFLGYLRRIPSGRPEQRLGLAGATDHGRLLAPSSVQRKLAATSSFLRVGDRDRVPPTGVGMVGDQNCHHFGATSAGNTDRAGLPPHTDSRSAGRCARRAPSTATETLVSPRECPGHRFIIRSVCVPRPETADDQRIHVCSRTRTVPRSSAAAPPLTTHKRTEHHRALSRHHCAPSSHTGVADRRRVDPR